MAAVAVMLMAGAACSGSGGEPSPGDGDGDGGGDGSSVVPLSELDGASTPSSFVLEVDVEGATSAKLVVDGDYVGEETSTPPRFRLELAAGEHRARVRATVDGEETRVDAEFTVGDDGATSTTSASDPTTAPPPPAAAGEETVVTTPEELQAAMGSAQPGQVIRLVDGEYQFDERLVAEPSGTAEAPITLRGTRAAMIRSRNASGDYGLHITGDFWRIEGLTVAHATKGIVLDGSVGTVIDGVEVYDIGDEGVHFRSCSSDGVLRNSHVHDTGRNSPQYGEGVYVGSANSNWSDYQCTDATEGVEEGDNTERVLVEDNVFEDITAEGADLKEGTDSGTLRRNVFRRTGLSGQNSADSAVDAKGNNWLIEDNVVTETDAPWDDDGEMQPSEFADGFQTHEVYDGYGTGNTFDGNRVESAVPGFAIGLYPQLDNIVTCDNSGPDATEGLVGDNGQPARCQS
ncbi:MAG: right-handed parallel beta-helix repeat-containing protein [Acidimicrobiales bacterium]